MCHIFSSSSYSAYGLKDHDPNQGFPTAVKWDTDWERTPSWVFSYIPSTQDGAASHHPLSVLVFRNNYKKTGEDGNRDYQGSKI